MRQLNCSNDQHSFSGLVSPDSSMSRTAPPNQDAQSLSSLFSPDRIGIPEHLDQQDVCFFCGLTTEEASGQGLYLTPCPFCKEIYSCCSLHFDIHRPAKVCHPFLIKKSPKLGRYMVASRDINPCELILSEEPAVVGPYAKTSPGCMTCFKKVDGSFVCQFCHFPVCNEECAAGSLHQNECYFLRTKVMDPLPQSNGPIQMSSASRNRAAISSFVCVTPLRMLLKKDTDPLVFARINMLRDHEKNDDANNLYEKQINLQLVNAALLLQEAYSNAKTFSQTDIQRMIGILRTNGMKIEPHGDKGIPGVALYPVYCLINHACYNNTNYVKFPDFHLELRSQTAIRKGEQILTRYVSSTIGNMRRREDIRRYWFFDCQCARCCDVTEFGTNMSAILCFNCNGGYLLPVEAMDFKSEWECVNCGLKCGHQTVDEVISALESQVRTCSNRSRKCRPARSSSITTSLPPWAQNKVHSIISLTQNMKELENGDIFGLEEMLFHYSKLLHPNHYILIDIMHNLVHLYAAKSPLTRPEKERKIQLCVSVLDVLGKVDPGYTKWRGTLLQELIHPLMLISKEDHKARRISSAEFQRRLGFCTKKLIEARKCLNGGFSSLSDEDDDLHTKWLEQRAAR